MGECASLSMCPNLLVVALVRLRGQDEGRQVLSQMGLRKPQEVSGFVPVLGFREIEGSG